MSISKEKTKSPGTSRRTRASGGLLAIESLGDLLGLGAQTVLARRDESVRVKRMRAHIGSPNARARIVVTPMRKSIPCCATMDPMNEPIWNKFLTERDKQVFAAGGFGSRQGFGKRPAILVIDVNYNFCGDRPEPILESIKRWRNSCGEEAWTAVDRIAELVAVAHQQRIPVIYSTGQDPRPDTFDAGRWADKNSRRSEDHVE